MRAFFNVFRAHLKLYLTLLAVGTVPAIFGYFPILFVTTAIVVVSLVASVAQSRGRENGQPEKPIENYSRKQLIAGLQNANKELAENEREIARLRESVENLSQADVDIRLRDKVLQLVAAQLTAYDKSRGTISAEDTIEYLRGTLIALGEEFQAEQTAHFTAEDWEESLRDQQAFARARKHQNG
jgi:hypothetical protein